VAQCSRPCPPPWQSPPRHSSLRDAPRLPTLAPTPIAHAVGGTAALSPRRRSSSLSHSSNGGQELQPLPRREVCQCIPWRIEVKVL
jgi:hypothetical protein